MKRRTPPRVSRTAPAPRRRGVAMLLVIVALGTGVVLAGAYMTSNSSAGSVGDNAASAVKASWSAKAASDIGVAILETDLDWRTAIADGTLMSGQPIAGGNVTITFTNLKGAPPAADDPEVIMTVTATVNGVESKTQKLVRLIPEADVDEAVENMVDEFTVFADEVLEVDSTSAVGVWSASPEAHSSKIGKIGVGFADGSNLQVSSSARIGKTGVFVPSTAGASLRSAITNTKFTTGARLPVNIPAPPKKMPGDFDGLTPIAGDIEYSVNPVTLPSAYYQDLRLRDGSVATINEAFGTHYAFHDIEMDNGAVLAITGNVKLRVDDDFLISDGSAIELMTADSSVEIWIADSLIVVDSTIGFARTVAQNAGRSRDDSFKYRSPKSVRIYGVWRDDSYVDDEVDGQHVRIEDNALVVANIYAPFAEVRISGGGTLFGRASGRFMRVTNNGAILGDPALDKGIGLTEKYGPLYKENGDPIDGLVDALAAVDENSGWDVVKSSLTSTLESSLSLVGGLLGGGKTGGTESSTARKRGRAIARDWPMKAFAMEIKEKKEDVADEPDGSFLVAKADESNDAIDD